MKLLHLLLPCFWQLSIAAPAKGEFVIGLYGPVTSVGHTIMVTAMLFDLDFEKNFDPVLVNKYGPPIVPVPDLEDFRLKSYIGNSNSNTDAGVKTVLDWCLGAAPFEKIAGLVGGYHSAISMPVANLATVFSTVQVSWGSTSPKLSNKDQYPWFLRAIPPDSIQGMAMWRWTMDTNIPSVTCIFQMEAYGEGLFSAVQNLAAEAKMAYRISGVGIPFMTSNYNYATSTAKLLQALGLGSKTFLLFMTKDQATSFLKVMSDSGIVCTSLNNFVCSQSQIVGSEGVDLLDGRITGFTNKADMPVGLTKFSPISQGPEFSKFASMWKKMTAAEVYGSLATKYLVANFKVPLPGSVSPLTDDAFLDTSAMQLEDPFIFDSGYTFVLAINEMLKNGEVMDDIKGQKLLDVVKTVNFEGISGAVAFDKQGDRLASYYLLQWIPDDMSVPTGDRSMQQIGVYNAATDKLTYSKTPIWMYLDSSTIYQNEKPPPELTMCLPGYSPDGVTGLCTACSSGTASSGGAGAKCESCPPGRHAIDSLNKSTAAAAIACKDCEQGLYAESNGATACVKCGEGTWTDDFASKICERCAVGRFADFKGARACKSCPGKATTDIQGATLPSDCGCPEGSYRVGDTTQWTTVECADCPLGMSCGFGSVEPGKNGTVEPILEPFYWSDPAEPLSVFRCGSSKRCPGGPPGASCAPNLMERACSSCLDGWVWTGEKCNECASVEQTSLLFPVVPILLTPLIAVIMYKLFGDTYQKWGTWQNGISSVVFIVMNHYQITTIMKNSNMVLPESSKGVFEAFSFTSDVGTIFKPGCAGFASFQKRLIMNTAGPAILGAGFLAAFLISIVVSKVSGKPQLAMEKNRLCNCYLSLVFTFFAGIVEMALTMFKCGPNPNGKSSLIIDRGVVCFEEEWNGLIAIGLVAVALWCIGMGGLFVYAVLKAPTFFHDPGQQMRWKFLFIKYRSDVHWWSLVFVFKGLLLNIGFMFLVTGVSQIMWIMVIILGYSGLSSLFRPWRHLYVNILDGGAHLCLTLVAAALMWFARTSVEDPAALDGDMSGLVTAWSVIVFPLAIAVVAITYWSQTSEASKLKQRKDTDKAWACMTNLVNDKDKNQFHTDMVGLSDFDYLFVNQSFTVLTSELLGVKSHSGISSKKLEKRTLEDAENKPKASSVFV